MKKIFAAVAIMFLSLVILSGCGRSEAARRVDRMINDMDRVSLESESQLTHVRRAYEALSAAEKEEVRQLRKLEKAEETYQNYLRINREIAEMAEIADGSFSDAESGISYLLERADEILSEYRKMSSFEKTQIRGVDGIRDAAEKLKTYVENAKTAAAAYVKAFLTVHAGTGDTVTGVYCVKNLRSGEEYHFFALTYEDDAGKTHTVYSTAQASAQIDAETMASHPEIFFADEPATADTDAAANGNVTLDAAEILAMAK